MKVSIIIPVYNEALAITELLRRVLKAPLPDQWQKEIIVVDDGSIDRTIQNINEFISEHSLEETPVQLHESHINHGKGAALRAGFKIATGDVFIVQDGDLEYDPNDYCKLLEPFKDPNTHIVYGSRFMNGNPKGMRLPNFIANKMLTWATILLYRHKITDEATCYKVFRKTVLDAFNLNCRHFEFCPEFTGKALNAGFRIHEVPISYDPRGILEGKKIKARDGFVAIWWLVKTRFGW